MTVIPKNTENHTGRYSAQHHYQIALIGNPNCGKTTLFNRLTGAQQTTGNWPGVTVEQKSGHFKINQTPFHLIDLPGVYSLEQSQHCGLDERVACNFLQCQPADLIINVIDATNLERQLFLTAQLLHMGLPVVVVLNRMDLLKDYNLHIDIEKLSNALGCPVIPISAYHNKGIDELKQKLPEYLNQKTSISFELPEELAISFGKLQLMMEGHVEIKEKRSCWKSLQMLVNPQSAPENVRTFCQQEKQQLEKTYSEDLELISADLYFQFAHDSAHASETRTDQFTRNTTDVIDHWVLHPVLGMPIFLLVMYLLFATSIAFGNVFIDFFDLGAQALFVDTPSYLLQQINAPEWLITVLANGIGGGIQVVATFIPVIGALFILLSILEDTGYMQRAALVVDNLMRKLGLSGQAFVPLVVGFGCNIPAVLATRTLPDSKDRIKTALMTPFMSCSARLTVYVMFATAFFPDNAALIVFTLYLVGILAAVLTALLLKYTLLQGKVSPLLMELPIYHKPTALNVLLNARNKLKSFIIDAGKVIVIVVMVLNVLNSLGSDGSFGHENQSDSVLSKIAKAATPIVAPLGITEENWPATVGLFTGILAKEVVVGSLDALYQQKTPMSASEDSYALIPALTEASATIGDNLQNLFANLADPLGLSSIQSIEDKSLIADEQGFELSTLDKMANYFDGQVGAFAYLLLILLYFPCVATFGALKQELGSKWALFSAGWSLFLGYAVAVSFYQIMIFERHPTTSSLWLLAFSLIFIALFISLKRIANSSKTQQTV